MRPLNLKSFDLKKQYVSKYRLNGTCYNKSFDNIAIISPDTIRNVTACTGKQI